MSDPLFGTPPTATPYAGTTGHSGSDTSRERAVREASDGTASFRQSRILQLLGNAGPTGMTVVELRASRYGLGHHGTVSGALSSMHAEGLIAALRHDRRGGAGVYVRPEHVLGRIVRPFNPNKATQESASATNEPKAPAIKSLTPAERTLLANAQASVQRYGRAQTMPVRTQNLVALLALVERLAK